MMTPLTVGSLFSGIGGLDRGFERAGFEIRWMCEIDPFCRKVLNKHWPEVPIYEDVRSIRGSAGDTELISNTSIRGVEKQRLSAKGKISLGHVDGTREEVEPIDVLIGGFPCQDISLAGHGAGLDGSRSGLWWEFYRLIGELRPRYVVLENVAALVIRGLPAILGALSEIGYDAEWQIVSAASLGAPHLRERFFVVAYPNVNTESEKQKGYESLYEGRSEFAPRIGTDDRNIARQSTQRNVQCFLGKVQDVADADVVSNEQSKPQSDIRYLPECFEGNGNQNTWSVEPPVGRVASRIPRRVDRLRSLGNSVVPQVAEYVARCIAAHAEASP